MRARVRTLRLISALALAIPLVRLLSGCVAGDEPLPDGGLGTRSQAIGTLCEADSSCASAHCECLDFDCTQRMCAPDECICGYGTSGSCGAALRRGIKDPGDCDGATASCRDLNSCAR